MLSQRKKACHSPEETAIYNIGKPINQSINQMITSNSAFQGVLTGISSSPRNFNLEL
jgi:hypothetical protein